MQHDYYNLGLEIMHDHCSVVITKLSDFMIAKDTKIHSITHLYLPHSNLQSYLSTPRLQFKFLVNLRLCQNLKFLNFMDNKLGIAELQFMLPVINVLPNLKYVNIRHNRLSEGEVNECVGRINPQIVLLADYVRNIEQFQLPDTKWRFVCPWSNVELEEMLAVATSIFNDNPLLSKLHAYRDANREKLFPLLEPHNLQTNLALSAVLVKGQVYLLPKYNLCPQTISEYNLAHSDKINSTYKRISLAIHSEKAGLASKILKISRFLIRKQVSEYSFFNEINIYHNLGRNAQGLIRFYSSNPFSFNRYKNYLIMDYVPGDDSWELVSNVFNRTRNDLFSTHIHKLISEEKAIALNATLSHLLAILILHAHGILHRDLKPENCLVQNNGEIVVIDFGFSSIINHGAYGGDYGLVGTPAYMAPELHNNANHVTNEMYSHLTESYAVGVMLRQMLYPVAKAINNTFIFTRDDTTYGDLEMHLQPHFHNGISQNYSPALASNIQALTHKQPTQRATILNAFLNISEHYPEQVAILFNTTLATLADRINSSFNTYPQAHYLTVEILPNFKQLLDDFNFLADQSNFNKLIHVTRLTIYLKSLRIFELCNGVIPNSSKEILQTHIKGLFDRKYTSDNYSFTDKFYQCEDLDLQIDKHALLQNQLLENVAQAHIYICAQGIQLSAEQLKELLDIQAYLRYQWLTGAPLPELIIYIKNKLEPIDQEIHRQNAQVEPIMSLLNTIEGIFGTELHAVPTKRAKLR